MTHFARYRLGLFVGTFVVSAAVFVIQSVRFYRDRSEANLFDREMATATHANAALPNSVQKIEALASAGAKKTGVARLLSVSTPKAGVLQLEWEGTPTATAAYLTALATDARVGTCRLLRVMPVDSRGPLLRASASFALGPVPRAVVLHKTEFKNGRNVFAALWHEESASNLQDHLAELKREEKLRHDEEAKQEAERRVQDEANRLTEKRRQLESGLVLTGIVSNGREPLAFVNNRSSGGRTVMLRSGDVIEEARVTSIEADKGELRLDYSGKFQISLKINSGAGVQ